MTTPNAALLARIVLERTIAIARIPAPTGREARRAELVKGWWSADGWDRVDGDETGNVWALARSGTGGAVVLCAHLDTVFGDDIPHEVREDGGRLLGPGVGDDSVAVASLSAIGDLLRNTSGRPVWLLGTVGEEGLGNLRGIRGALKTFASPIDVVIAVEGNYLGRVSTMGVGSIRWRVRVTGPGGHAWEAPDAPSAIHAVAAMVAELDTLRVAEARTAVNIGGIGGGEAINARARLAWFELDLRADDAAALDVLGKSARAAIDHHVRSGLDVDIQELGHRPAGRLVDDHPIVLAAVAALQDAGIEPAFVATSTDANAAHDRGIPAIALGITTGGGEHTPGEWIDVAPIADGLAVLAATVVNIEEALA
jgi:acetylornithine deacetylase/succinyl-diaminopimelate desuccinylase-like protein